MLLCFWATQTAVAALDICTRAGQPTFTPCLPLHKAATAIKHVTHSYIRNKSFLQQISEFAFSFEVHELEPTVAHAMEDLQDIDDLVYTVSDTAGIVQWPYVIWWPHRAAGYTCWMSREACFLMKFYSSGLPF
jgi:hypothetical protein